MANFSSTYPSTRPVFNADFSNAGRLDSRITFSRSDTPPTYAAPSAVHYWSNEKHLSSDNLLLQSSDFDTSWYYQGLSARTGGQTDPSGGTAGFTLVEDGAAAFHRVTQDVSATGEIAFTVYAKRNTGTRYLNLTISTSSSSTGAGLATFDLAGGATHTDNGASSTLTNLSATQTASGNGYYKCVFKATSTGTTSAHISLSSDATPISNNYGLVLYTGDNSSSLDIAFASLSSVGSQEYLPTTTQIARAYAPTLKSVSYAGQPRFEYSPTDSASMGLLIEGQAQNLISYSDDITNAWWGKVFVSDYSNAAVGPTGTLNADLIVPSAVTNSSHYLQKTGIATTVSTTYTYSLYVKSAGVTKFAILMFQNSSPYTQFGFASVDLGDATISGSIGSGATIESVGNGWYRLSVSGAALTTVSNPRLWFQDSTGNFTYTPNGYDGLLVAGQQFEANSFPSSLISTNGSQVTRAADSASAVASGIGYTGGPMTLVTDTTVSDPTSTQFRAAAYVYVDSSNAAGIWATSSDSRIARVETGGIGGNVGTNSGVNGKAALSIDTNDIAACLNGGTVATDTSHAMADFGSATLYVGNFGTYANQLNGHIKRLAVFNTALSDQNLQSLTAS